VLFKWPLIRQLRGRGYDKGMEAMSDKSTRHHPLDWERPDQADLLAIIKD
jgi:hypothetical protein